MLAQCNSIESKDAAGARVLRLLVSSHTVWESVTDSLVCWTTWSTVQVEELQRVREQLEAQVEALAAQMRALDDENARLRVRPSPQ